jgi:hypothetical protein
MRRLTRLFLLAFLLAVPNITFGEESTKVYLRDSNELLVPVEVNTALQYIDYGQVMVGTELAIVIDSNLAEHWSGRLLIEGDYNDFGVLYGRGPYDDFGSGYMGSIFPAAGFFAAVFPAAPYWEEEEKYVQGFDVYTDYDVNVGDWFIIDYNAIAVGDANIAFYWQQDSPPFEYGLIHCIQFLQVPTRDFDGDGIVDFYDFSIFSMYWHDSNCTDPDSCLGTNLDNYGFVDLNDLMLFTEYWLKKTK